jgi:hypothetical protein
LKHCICVNWILPSHFADAKALGEHDLILENYSYRDARDPFRPYLILREFLELRRGGLDLFEGEFICPT